MSTLNPPRGCSQAVIRQSSTDMNLRATFVVSCKYVKALLAINACHDGDESKICMRAHDVVYMFASSTELGKTDLLWCINGLYFGREQSARCQRHAMCCQGVLTNR